MRERRMQATGRGAVLRVARAVARRSVVTVVSVVMIAEYLSAPVSAWAAQLEVDAPAPIEQGVGSASDFTQGNERAERDIADEWANGPLSIGESGTYVLGHDVSATAPLTVSAKRGQEIVIDLKGHSVTVTGQNPFAIDLSHNEGSVRIIDSARKQGDKATASIDLESDRASASVAAVSWNAAAGADDSGASLAIEGVVIKAAVKTKDVAISGAPISAYAVYAGRTEGNLKELEPGAAHDLPVSLEDVKLVASVSTAEVDAKEAAALARDHGEAVLSSDDAGQAAAFLATVPGATLKGSYESELSSPKGTFDFAGAEAADAPVLEKGFKPATTLAVNVAGNPAGAVVARAASGDEAKRLASKVVDGTAQGLEAAANGADILLSVPAVPQEDAAGLDGSGSATPAPDSTGAAPAADLPSEAVDITDQITGGKHGYEITRGGTYYITKDVDWTSYNGQAAIWVDLDSAGNEDQPVTILLQGHKLNVTAKLEDKSNSGFDAGGIVVNTGSNVTIDGGVDAAGNHGQVNLKGISGSVGSNLMNGVRFAGWEMSVPENPQFTIRNLDVSIVSGQSNGVASNSTNAGSVSGIGVASYYTGGSLDVKDSRVKIDLTGYDATPSFDNMLARGVYVEPSTSSSAFAVTLDDATVDVTGGPVRAGTTTMQANAVSSAVPVTIKGGSYRAANPKGAAVAIDAASQVVIEPDDAGKGVALAVGAAASDGRGLDASNVMSGSNPGDGYVHLGAPVTWSAENVSGTAAALYDPAGNTFMIGAGFSGKALPTVVSDNSEDIQIASYDADFTPAVSQYTAIAGYFANALGNGTAPVADENGVHFGKGEVKPVFQLVGSDGSSTPYQALSDAIKNAKPGDVIKVGDQFDSHDGLDIATAQKGGSYTIDLDGHDVAYIRVNTGAGASFTVENGNAAKRPIISGGASDGTYLSLGPAVDPDQKAPVDSLVLKGIDFDFSNVKLASAPIVTTSSKAGNSSLTLDDVHAEGTLSGAASLRLMDIQGDLTVTGASRISATASEANRGTIDVAKQSFEWDLKEETPTPEPVVRIDGGSTVSYALAEGSKALGGSAISSSRTKLTVTGGASITAAGIGGKNEFSGMPMRVRALVDRSSIGDDSKDPSVTIDGASLSALDASGSGDPSFLAAIDMDGSDSKLSLSGADTLEGSIMASAPFKVLSTFQLAGDGKAVSVASSSELNASGFGKDVFAYGDADISDMAGLFVAAKDSVYAGATARSVSSDAKKLYWDRTFAVRDVDTGASYDTLQAAADASRDGANLKLGRDLSYSAPVVLSGKRLSIDLAGHALSIAPGALAIQLKDAKGNAAADTVPAALAVARRAAVTLRDSGDAKSGERGSLSIKVPLGQGAYASGIDVREEGSLVLDGVRVSVGSRRTAGATDVSGYELVGVNALSGSLSLQNGAAVSASDADTLDRASAAAPLVRADAASGAFARSLRDASTDPAIAASTGSSSALEAAPARVKGIQAASGSWQSLSADGVYGAEQSVGASSVSVDRSSAVFAKTVFYSSGNGRIYSRGSLAAQGGTSASGSIRAVPQLHRVVLQPGSALDSEIQSAFKRSAVYDDAASTSPDGLRTFGAHAYHAFLELSDGTWVWAVSDQGTSDAKPELKAAHVYLQTTYDVAGDAMGVSGVAGKGSTGESAADVSVAGSITAEATGDATAVAAGGTGAWNVLGALHASSSRGLFPHLSGAFDFAGDLGWKVDGVPAGQSVFYGQRIDLGYASASSADRGYAMVTSAMLVTDGAPVTRGITSDGRARVILDGAVSASVAGEDAAALEVPGTLGIAKGFAPATQPLTVAGTGSAQAGASFAESVDGTALTADTAALFKPLDAPASLSLYADGTRLLWGASQTISFVSDGQVVKVVPNVPAGRSVSLPRVSKPEDDVHTYTFLGWATKEGASAPDVPASATSVVAGGASTYYAVFRADSRTKSLTFSGAKTKDGRDLPEAELEAPVNGKLSGDLPAAADYQVSGGTVMRFMGWKIDWSGDHALNVTVGTGAFVTSADLKKLTFSSDRWTQPSYSFTAAYLPVAPGRVVASFKTGFASCAAAVQKGTAVREADIVPLMGSFNRSGVDPEGRQLPPYDPEAAADEESEFAYWYESDAGKRSDFVPLTADAVYTARFNRSKKMANVSFSYYAKGASGYVYQAYRDGSGSAFVRVASGSSPSKALNALVDAAGSSFVQDGRRYTFIGWSVRNDNTGDDSASAAFGTGDADLPKVVAPTVEPSSPEAAATYYAIYRVEEVPYHVTFLHDGDELGSFENVKGAETIADLAAAHGLRAPVSSDPDEVFMGWAKEGSDTVLPVSTRVQDAASDDGSLKLHAVFGSGEPVRLQFSYPDDSGAQAVLEVTAPAGRTLGSDEDLAAKVPVTYKRGATFAGWRVKGGGKLDGRSFSVASTVVTAAYAMDASSPVTLVAAFKPVDVDAAKGTSIDVSNALLRDQDSDGAVASLKDAASLDPDLEAAVKAGNHTGDPTAYGFSLELASGPRGSAVSSDFGAVSLSFPASGYVKAYWLGSDGSVKQSAPKLARDGKVTLEISDYASTAPRGNIAIAPAYSTDCAYESARAVVAARSKLDDADYTEATIEALDGKRDEAMAQIAKLSDSYASSGDGALSDAQKKALDDVASQAVSWLRAQPHDLADAKALAAAKTTYATMLDTAYAAMRRESYDATGWSSIVSAYRDGRAQIAAAENDAAARAALDGAVKKMAGVAPAQSGSGAGNQVPTGSSQLPATLGQAAGTGLSALASPAAGASNGLSAASAAGKAGSSDGLAAPAAAAGGSSKQPSVNPGSLLGISLVNLDADAAKDRGLSVDAGALVSKVTKGGPADVAGIEVGDVIVKADGADVKSVSDLAAALAGKGAGDEVKLSILRGGSERDLSVKLASSSSKSTASKADSSSSDQKPAQGSWIARNAPLVIGLVVIAAAAALIIWLRVRGRSAVPAATGDVSDSDLTRPLDGGSKGDGAGSIRF